MNSIDRDFERTLDRVVGRERFVHRNSQIPFQFVPGGTFWMGMSAEEERAARALAPNLAADVDEMRPVRSRTTGPLLVSITPVLNHQCNVDPENSNRVAYFEYAAAQSFAKKLNCRLPHEFEWEYLYRAGTKTLFPFGNHVPPELDLKGWLASDFSHAAEFAPNGFGLLGMCNPEWCQDKFTVNLSAGAPILDGSYTIRGGGAYFWPWQDEEWVWCMSAMRSPSSGLEDGQACLRLVYDFST